MSLDNETNSDTATFEHFGQTWTVPNKRHLSHVRFMRDSARLGVGGLDFMIAEAFLRPDVSPQNQQEPDQWAQLCKLDPDAKALDEFTSALTKAIGLGAPGN